MSILSTDTTKITTDNISQALSACYMPGTIQSTLHVLCAKGGINWLWQVTDFQRKLAPFLRGVEAKIFTQLPEWESERKYERNKWIISKVLVKVFGLYSTKLGLKQLRSDRKCIGLCN